jgi:asparagine synthase (glutamine-hydrolysing)
MAEPSWLNEAFDKRLRLRERWRSAGGGQHAGDRLRGQSYDLLSGPFWPWRFERYDAGWTRLPLEVRHPFFDRRLVAFMLAIPPMPWCPNKALLRIAMRGRLPEAVRRRPKRPLACDPIVARLRLQPSRNLLAFEPAARLAEYVDLESLAAASGRLTMMTPSEVWMNLRPRDLSSWLQRVESGSCHPESRSAHPCH